MARKRFRLYNILKNVSKLIVSLLLVVRLPLDVFQKKIAPFFQEQPIINNGAGRAGMPASNPCRANAPFSRSHSLSLGTHCWSKSINPIRGLFFSLLLFHFTVQVFCYFARWLCPWERGHYHIPPYSNASVG